MERFSLDGGRGWLTVREENGRVRAEAQLPDDGRGLYKAWLLGERGRALAGTFVPEGGALKLRRALSLDELRAICAAVDIPVVAIGGVNAENILALRGSGAAGAAVVSGLYAQPHPGAAAKRLRELADRAFGEQEEQP